MSEILLEIVRLCINGLTATFLAVVASKYFWPNAENCLRSRFAKSGPEVIKLFSYSTQLSMEFILLINVKMTTIVGILTFISMINTTSERPEIRNVFICR